MSNDKLYLKVEYNVDDPISKDEAKGWVSGDFNDFLKLTPEETDQVNIQFHRDKMDEDYLEKLHNQTTPGLWYPRAGDDDMCMNARWISVDPGKGFQHDGYIYDQDSTKTVAITLLQSPRLADTADTHDSNLLFICEAKAAIPRLIEEIRRLRKEAQ
jgi:hypothetical protein